MLFHLDDVQCICVYFLWHKSVYHIFLSSKAYVQRHIMTSESRINSSKEHLPEYENEEYKERKEYSDVIHGSQHDEQLSPQIRHEPDQFEDPQ